MARSKSPLLRLAPAFLTSLLMHAAAMLALAAGVMQLRGAAPPQAQASVDPALIEPAAYPPDQPKQIPVGIEKGAPSSLNWIGYDTYEKHLAMLAETEQPALGTEEQGPIVDSTPSAASMPSPPSSPQPPAMQEHPAATAPTVEVLAPSPAGSHAPAASALEPEKTPNRPEPSADAPDVARKPLQPAPHSEQGLDVPDWFRKLGPLGFSDSQESVGLGTAQSKPTQTPAARPTTDDAPRPPTPESPITPPAPPRQSTDPASPDQSPSPTLSPTPTPSPVPPAPKPDAAQPAPSPPSPPEQTPSQPSPSRPAQPPAQSPARGRGSPADKESDPTSIIDVPRDQWQLGKPLSAQGLELKPKRPSFTLLTLLTAAPCNPLCRIEFDSDGVPVNARVLKTSCDPRIDRDIEASLYGWRASGKALTELTNDQTIGVNIRIILVKPPD